MKFQYLCSSWQGMIQQAVFFAGMGYHSYCRTLYPEKKKDGWGKTDRKLIDKYRMEKSKFQRAGQKRKGFANFMFLRHENLAVIFRTAGVPSPGIPDDDIFRDIRQTPLRIPAGSLTLDVYVCKDRKSRGSFSVRLERESYRDVRDWLLDAAQSGNREKLLSGFDRLNGIPAWHGVISQKAMLARYLAKKAGKHGMRLSAGDFRINTRRKIYTVFAEN